MLKRWKFRAKMLLIPLLATVGFVSVLVVSSWLGIRNGRLLNRIESGYAPALELSRDLEEHLSSTQRGLQDAVAALDGEALEETAAIREAFTARIRREGGNPVLREHDTDALVRDYERYYELARRTSAKLIEGDSGDHVMESLEEMSSAYNRLNETLRANTDRDRQAMRNAFASARANQSLSMWVFGGIALSLVVILGGLSLRLSGQVVSAVATLARAARDIASDDMTRLAADAELMARGDLTRVTSVTERLLPVESDDELGQMATSFNLMVTKLGEISGAVNSVSKGLRDLVIHVQTAADEVAAGSNLIATSSNHAVGFTDTTVQAVESMTSALHEMSANTQNVARNAYSQSVSTGQTLASVAQMLDSVKTVANAAERLVSITTKASNSVSNGHRAMRAASTGMAEIGRVINTSAGFVEDLGSMANDIGSIVAVIDDIAEQTHLLALNATIEAARAGEHGMGFAVVADEVGKLAERSANSTREISDIVRRIQVKVEAAVKNMEQSTSIVADGATRTQELTSHLDEILSSVTEVTECSQDIRRATSEQSQGTLDIEKATAKLSELTEEIRAATTEQSSGTDQVVESIESIRGMVQQNATSSNDLASSAEELSRQARVMRELSSRFSVRREVPRATERIEALHAASIRS